MADVAIFDLDGTLVDTPTGIVRSFAAAFTELGLPVPPAAAIRATIGIPLARAFAQLLGVGPADPPVVRTVAAYRVAFRELVLPVAADLVFPGVAAGLAALRRDGVALAVATSKLRAGADELLAAAGLRDRFQVVVGADEVANPKPAPDTGLLALDRLRAPASGAVMVGDSTHDLLMASAAGIRTIAVSYGAHPREALAAANPTWLVDTFDEVVELITDRTAPPPPRRA